MCATVGSIVNSWKNVKAFGAIGDYVSAAYSAEAAGHIEGFRFINGPTENINLFTGMVKSVHYDEGKFVTRAEDVLQEFHDKKVGDSDNTVTFSDTIPSDIAWTLCTCYGGLPDSKDTGNGFIDYTSFNEWAAIFSGDSVTLSAEYDGIKVTEALYKICKMTGSIAYVDGAGKPGASTHKNRPPTLRRTLVNSLLDRFGAECGSVRLGTKLANVKNRLLGKSHRAHAKA